MNHEVTEVIKDAALRSTPPIGVSMFGTSIGLSDMVYAITILYVALQILVISPKVYNIFKKRRSGD